MTGNWKASLLLLSATSLMVGGPGGCVGPAAVADETTGSIVGYASRASISQQTASRQTTNIAAPSKGPAGPAHAVPSYPDLAEQTTASPPDQPTTGIDARTGALQNSPTGAATLSDEQQKRINEVISKQRPAVVADVETALSVGMALPESIHGQPLPREIVEIVPAYRDDNYAVIGNSIVIVEPRTRKIVLMVSRAGHAESGAAPVIPKSKINLSAEQRHIIKEIVLKDRNAPPASDDVTIQVGGKLPKGVDIRPLPELVVDKVPQVRSYNYFVKSDQVVLVDPQSNEVIEVID